MGRGLALNGLVTVIGLGLVVTSGLSVAAAPPAAIATQVPLNVSEVVSGGTWTDGTANGTFRTITVQVTAPPEESGGEETAQVHLQWIGSRTPLDAVELIQSVPVSEFNALHLGSASVAIEAEMEGQAQITITSQDGDEKPPVTVVLIATTPGHYQVHPSVASNPPPAIRR